MQDISQLLNNANFNNVSFVCQDAGIVYAVKENLAVRCEFFHKLLYGGLKEAGQNQIHLPTAQSAHLLKVFEFLHTGEMLLPDTPEPELIMGVYELSRQYSIDDLKEKLIDELPRLLNAANVGEYLMSGSQVCICGLLNFKLCS